MADDQNGRKGEKSKKEDFKGKMNDSTMKSKENAKSDTSADVENTRKAKNDKDPITFGDMNRMIEMMWDRIDDRLRGFQEVSNQNRMTYNHDRYPPNIERGQIHRDQSPIPNIERNQLPNYDRANRVGFRHQGVQGYNRQRENEDANMLIQDNFDENDDFYTGIGPAAFYRDLPHPWNFNLPPRRDDRDRHEKVKQSPPNVIPKFSGKRNEYEEWRTHFIGAIHRGNLSMNAKLMALNEAMSESVKNSLTVVIEYSQNGYGNLVHALEREYGGADRLLDQAMSDIRFLQPIRPEKIDDLKHFVKKTSTYLMRLQNAGLHDERNTRATRNDFLKPMPPSYHSQYRRFITERHLGDNAQSVLDWSRFKLEELTQIYELRNQLNNDKRGNGNTLITTAEDSRLEVVEDLINFDDDKTPINSSEDLEWNAMITTNSKKNEFCPLCSNPDNISNHDINDCSIMKGLPPYCRKSMFFHLKLCFRCGKFNCMANKCQTKNACNLCSGNHHTLLHNSKDKKEDNVTALKISIDQSKGGLMSLEVDVKNPERKEKLRGYTLLDTCSDVNLISTEFASRLGLVGYTIPLTLNGVNGNDAEKVSMVSKVKVFRTDKKEWYTIPVFVVDKPAGNYKIPVKDDIADSNRAQDQVDVDLLIGTGYPIFFQQLESRLVDDGKKLQVLTPLGWSSIGEKQDYGKRNFAFLASAQELFMNHSLENKEKVSFNNLGGYALVERNGKEKENPEVVIIENNFTTLVTSTSDEITHKRSEIEVLQSLENILKSEWMIQNRSNEKEPRRLEKYALDVMNKSRKKAGEKYEIAWKAVDAIKAVMKEAGIAPHKFFSNSKEALKQVDKDDKLEMILLANVFEENQISEFSMTVLVMKSVNNDDLLFNTPKVLKNFRTKRQVAQSFPRLFDPLRFISPFNVYVQRRMPSMLDDPKMAWDDELGEEYKKRWNEWTNDVKTVTNMKPFEYWSEGYNESSKIHSGKLENSKVKVEYPERKEHLRRYTLYTCSDAIKAEEEKGEEQGNLNKPTKNQNVKTLKHWSEVCNKYTLSKVSKLMRSQDGISECWLCLTRSPNGTNL